MTENNVLAVANPVAALVAQAIQSQPRVRELEELYLSIPAVITDAATSAMAGELIKQMRSHTKTVKEERMSITRPINDGLDRIIARYKVLTDGMDDAGKDLTERNTVFLKEQRRIADEAEAKIRAEQEKKAAEEAARLEDEAKKLEAEAAAKQAEADRLQAEGAAAEAEAIQREAEAAAKAAEATTAEAETVLDEGTDTPAPIVMRTDRVRGVHGTSTGLRDYWKWVVTDLTLKSIPIEYLCLDEKKINRAVTRADNPIRDIKGLRIYNEPKAVSR